MTKPCARCGAPERVPHRSYCRVCHSKMNVQSYQHRHPSKIRLPGWAKEIAARLDQLIVQAGGDPKANDIQGLPDESA